MLHSQSSSVAPMPETMYFAYGSNLGFEQMALRCPSSVFLGRARLHGYEFQINERGYANVIPSRETASFVEGLCYRLSPTDERSLDRSEGVPTAYEKKLLELEFWCADADLIGRTVTNIVACEKYQDESALQAGDLQRGLSRDDTSRNQDGLPPRATPPVETQMKHEESTAGPGNSEGRENTAGVPKGQSVVALVYLSTRFTENGIPWDEYIGRMTTGFDRAVKLGVSHTYVRNCAEAFWPKDRD
ncbi:AIG2 family protein [Phlyctema vagabunda]|uniref:gamma-glutamylcyclotransferase n=1 Tax=Phlyctema vagabunda TaxID=108571 RepID=A0ABR4P835_9HELO